MPHQRFQCFDYTSVQKLLILDIGFCNNSRCRDLVKSPEIISISFP